MAQAAGNPKPFLTPEIVAADAGVACNVGARDAAAAKSA